MLKKLGKLLRRIPKNHSKAKATSHYSIKLSKPLRDFGDKFHTRKVMKIGSLIFGFVVVVSSLIYLSTHNIYQANPNPTHPNIDNNYFASEVVTIAADGTVPDIVLNQTAINKMRYAQEQGKTFWLGFRDENESAAPAFEYRTSQQSQLLVNSTPVKFGLVNNTSLLPSDDPICQFMPDSWRERLSGNGTASNRYLSLTTHIHGPTLGYRHFQAEQANQKHTWLWPEIYENNRGAMAFNFTDFGDGIDNARVVLPGQIEAWSGYSEVANPAGAKFRLVVFVNDYEGTLKSDGCIDVSLDDNIQIYHAMDNPIDISDVKINLKPSILEYPKDFVTPADFGSITIFNRSKNVTRTFKDGDIASLIRGDDYDFAFTTNTKANFSRFGLIRSGVSATDADVYKAYFADNSLNTFSFRQSQELYRMVNPFNRYTFGADINADPWALYSEVDTPTLYNLQGNHELFMYFSPKEANRIMLTKTPLSKSGQVYVVADSTMPITGTSTSNISYNMKNRSAGSFAAVDVNLSSNTSAVVSYNNEIRIWAKPDLGNYLVSIGVGSYFIFPSNNGGVSTAPFTETSIEQVAPDYFLTIPADIAESANQISFKFETISKPVVETKLLNGATTYNPANLAIEGEIKDTSGENATQRGFQMLTKADKDQLISASEAAIAAKNIASNSLAGSFGPGIFNSSINYSGKLAANTFYAFRAYAQNTKGAGYGDWVEFKTNPPAPVVPKAPTVQTLRYENLTATTVDLKAMIADVGTAANTLRGIKYTPENGTTVKYSESGTNFPASQEYSGAITNLSPNTKYKFQAFATSADGVGYGDEKEFTTPDLPPPPIPPRYRLTVTSPVVGGTATGTNDYVAGARVPISATSIPGYAFANWSDGSSNPNHIITMPGSALTITPIFNRNPTPPLPIQRYNLTIGSSSGGSATASLAGPFTTGENVVITAAPDATHNFSYWQEGSSNLGTNPSLAFSMPPRDRTITPIFTLKSTGPITPPTPLVHDINVTYSDGGTAMALNTSANDGEDAVIIISPNANYELDNITDTYKISGIETTETISSLIQPNTYTVYGVIEDHDIDVTFKPVTQNFVQNLIGSIQNMFVMAAQTLFRNLAILFGF